MCTADLMVDVNVDVDEMMTTGKAPQHVRAPFRAVHIHVMLCTTYTRSHRG